MALISRDDVISRQVPEPLAGDYPISRLGGEVRIQGITAKAEKDAIHADIAQHSDLTKAWKGVGLTAAPSLDEITCAAYAAACVVEPKLSTLEWLKFNEVDTVALGEIFGHCLVACRLADQPKIGGEPGISDGIEAAKEQLQSDPLNSAGGSTVSGN